MASTYLSKTLGTSTNTYKGTVSVWFKKSQVSSDQVIYGNYTSGTQRGKLVLASDSKLMYYQNDGGVNTIKLETSRLFRDFSAWYHVVLSVDTTQSTASDRVKLYVGGVQETSFTTATYPSQNTVFYLNANSVLNYIGQEGNSSDYWDGSMTHLNVIDGTAYTPTSFGESDSVSGIWKPKTAPSVTYGNNGFFLKFENSGAMGTDSSGNSNTFTVSGNLTQNVDTPSNNFATMNPLHKGANVALTNGNLTCTGSGSNASVASTLAVSTGKWYWEAKLNSSTNNYFNVGILKSDVRIDNLAFPGDVADGYVYAVDGNIYRSGSSLLSTGTTLSVGDIVGFLLDLDAGTLKLKKNGSDVYSGNAVVTGLNTGDFWYVAQGANPSSVDINFGSGFFGTTAVASAQADDGGLGIMEYDVPANYRVLCTKNIKDYG